MTDRPLTTTTEKVRARLKVRRAKEARFRLYGMIAIAIAVGFLVLLAGSADKLLH